MSNNQGSSRKQDSTPERTLMDSRKGIKNGEAQKKKERAGKSPSSRGTGRNCGVMHQSP
jgi:hypothetical protein